MELELDYSPKATDSIFADAEVIPQFEPEELIRRVNEFHKAGYVAIASVIVGSWQTSVRTALSMHELAANHLKKGALIGPFCMSYGIALPGIKLYRLEDSLRSR